MDRLPPVIVVLALALVGCEKRGGTSEAPPAGRERSNAVTADTKKPAPAAMCDRYFEGKAAPEFSWPALSSAAPEASKGWRWINVWATWCGPCIEEMPRLIEWQKRFAQSGVGVELTLLSIDESDADIERFQSKHSSTPKSLRMNPDKVSSWFRGLGIPETALPVQIFVAPDNRIRCVRASSLEDHDYEAVLALLRG